MAKICSWEGSSHIFEACAFVTLGFLKEFLWNTSSSGGSKEKMTPR